MNSLYPWYWRSLPLENRTGSEIFARLFLDPDKIATLLESPVAALDKEDKLSRYSICAGSPRQVDGKLQLWTPSLGKILPFLRSLLHSPTAIEPLIEHLPFTGGWLGWLGYDLAWEIERLPNLNGDCLPFPVAYWYEPADFAVLDHQKQLLWLAASVPEELDRLENRFTTIPPSSPAEAQILRTFHGTSLQNTLRRPLPPFSFVTSQIDYENSVRQALKYIQAGDVFQTNLSLRFETQTSADSWSIYRALQRINPSPFASYWQTPWGAVISCSPERLIQLQGNYAQTRPIAGTRSRGTNPEGDRKIAEELIVNFKERAEHIMLVDLERNDLGKVCQWGSVKVDELLSIERYSHVMHLVSNVIGNLRSEFDGIDLIRATFPGGTITGCPKVRCLEIIEELEPVRRNLFYGSCGYLDRRGWLDLNILIRTLLYSKTSFSLAKVWGQVGAGIVADSDPSQEWHESLNKAEAQLAALQLFS